MLHEGRRQLSQWQGRPRRVREVPCGVLSGAVRQASKHADASPNGDPASVQIDLWAGEQVLKKRDCCSKTLSIPQGRLEQQAQLTLDPFKSHSAWTSTEIHASISRAYLPAAAVLCFVRDTQTDIYPMRARAFAHMQAPSPPTLN